MVEAGEDISGDSGDRRKWTSTSELTMNKKELETECEWGGKKSSQMQTLAGFWFEQQDGGYCHSFFLFFILTT